MKNSAWKSILKIFGFVMGAIIAMMLALFIIMDNVSEDNQPLFLGILFVVFVSVIIGYSLIYRKKLKKEFNKVDEEFREGKISKSEHQEAINVKGKMQKIAYIFLTIAIVIKLILYLLK